MTLTFRYKKVKRPNGTEVKTPSIPITLTGKDGKYDFIALLDSGADISAIPKSIAELIGLDISGQKEETSGIGGNVSAVETNINIEISKGHELYNFIIPVKVILSKDEFPILLGRAGFFDKFIITFNQREERILLKKVDVNKEGISFGSEI